MQPSSRLRRRAEFRAVYQQGVKVVGTFLVVFAVAKTGVSARLGITATRKTGSAVVRNRARRRLRALFDLHGMGRESWHGDVVVNVRPGCAETSWVELEEDYLRCMRKATSQRRSGGSPLPC